LYIQGWHTASRRQFFRHFERHLKDRDIHEQGLIAALAEEADTIRRWTASTSRHYPGQPLKNTAEPAKQEVWLIYPAHTGFDMEGISGQPSNRYQGISGQPSNRYRQLRSI